MALALYLLANLAVALAVAGLVFAAGSLIAGLLPRGGPRVGPGARIALGLSAWMNLLFLCVALGILSPALLALLAITCLAGWWRFRAPLAPLSFSFPPLPGPVIALLALHLLFLLLRAMDPDPAWDAQVYHLTLPKWFLLTGGFVHFPLDIYAYFPLGFDFLFTFPLALGLHPAAAVLHLFAGLALLPLLLEYLPPRRAWLALLLFVSMEGVFCFMAVAYVEMPHAFFFLFSILSLKKYLHHGRRRDLAFAILGAGSLPAIKHLGFIALATLVAWFAFHSFKRGWPGVRSTLVFALLSGILASPTYLLNLALTGNPVYPALYNVFGGGEPDFWGPEVEEMIARFRAAEPPPWRSALDLYLAALPLNDRLDGFTSPPWLVLWPLLCWWLLRRLRRGDAGDTLLLAGYFLCWLFFYRSFRFLVPLLLFASVTVTAPLLAMLRKWRLGLDRLVLLALLCLGYPLFEHVLALKELAERVSPVRDFQSILRSAEPPAFKRLNAELAPDDRVLFLNDNRTFWLDRTYVRDGHFTFSQINMNLARCRSLADLDARLRRWGVTHVLYSLRGTSVELHPNSRWFLGKGRRVLWADKIEQDSVYLYRVEISHKID